MLLEKSWIYHAFCLLLPCGPSIFRDLSVLVIIQLFGCVGHHVGAGIQLVVSSSLKLAESSREKLCSVLSAPWIHRRPSRGIIFHKDGGRYNMLSSCVSGTRSLGEKNDFVQIPCDSPLECKNRIKDYYHHYHHHYHHHHHHRKYKGLQFLSKKRSEMPGLI